MLKVLSTTVVAYVVAQLLQSPIDRLVDVKDRTIPGDCTEASIITLVSAAILWQFVLRPLRARNAEAQAAVAEREAALRAEATHQEFRARLHRALEMSATEDATYSVTNHALEMVLPDHRTELCLADSSEAHLKVAATRGRGDTPPGCGVVAPHDCPAIRRGQTVEFPSDSELDACPYLRGRGPGKVAAVCVPVSMIGRSIGVLHAVAASGSHPPSAVISQLEVIADHVGTRIGTLRVLEQTHLQAATDSLTGLINRRTVENEIREMIRRGRPFSLAMGDLDHFKLLNDTHGHEVGDRALRVFARAMRNSLRDSDLISRFGGEEFVMVLPGVDVEGASAILQRAQEELLIALAQSNIPAFTASFGVAHSDATDSLEDLMRLADHALFTAKREGRNRVVFDSSLVPIGATHEVQVS
jgi:diguanylate cyclase (GGDEF)-like protein